MNGREIVDWLNRSPRYIHQEARKWFLDIRKRFVGTQKQYRYGTYTRWLSNKSVKYLGSGVGRKWDRPAVSAFKGFVRGTVDHGNVTLTMGTPSDSKSGFARALDQRSAGSFGISSSQWMPIPNYQNMMRFGYWGNGDPRYFRSKIKSFRGSKDFFSIKRNGVIYFINKKDLRSGDTFRTVTFFKLVKNVRHPNLDFQFESKFDSELPKYIQLGKNRFDRAIRAIEKGYVKN